MFKEQGGSLKNLTRGYAGQSAAATFPSHEGTPSAPGETHADLKIRRGASPITELSVQAADGSGFLLPLSLPACRRQGKGKTPGISEGDRRLAPTCSALPELSPAARADPSALCPRRAGRRAARMVRGRTHRPQAGDLSTPAALNQGGVGQVWSRCWWSRQRMATVGA